MRRRIECMLALLALLLSFPALAQTETVAVVQGKILASDGSRVLYVPTGQPTVLKLRHANGLEQTIFSDPGYVIARAYLTNTGAIFTGGGPLFSDQLFLYNGASTQLIATINSDLSLVAKGDYAAFSGRLGISSGVPSVFWMNTASGSILQMPGMNGNTEIDITSGGVLAYWSSAGYSGPGDQSVDYNIIAFDGTNTRRVTNTTTGIFNVYPVTDGTHFVFIREQVCCSTTFSNVILSDGITEVLLRSGTGNQRSAPGDGYRINAGWVAFLATDGTLMLRDPGGASVAVGAAGGISAVSEFGEVVFYNSAGENFLRLANGTIVDIGKYSGAFNIGRDWYFYQDGLLVRYVDGRLVAVDATFASNPNTYTTIDGATLYGTTDISVARSITLSGRTTLDTRGFALTFSGALAGPGGLEITGGGAVTLLGQNSYSGGTAIADTMVTGNSRSLQGSIFNGGSLIFDQGFDGRFLGTISGGGTIRKTGNGTLTLTGAQPYTGATVIDAGTLRLESIDTPSPFTLNAGLLTGNGRIGALSATGGVIRPGAPGTTLASTGAITLGPGSTYVADLVPGGGASLLTATGPANINGARLFLAFGSGQYRLGDSWRILTAAGFNGAFATVDAPTIRLLEPTLRYGATALDVQLTLNRSEWTALAATRNQAAAAGAAANLPTNSPLLRNLLTVGDAGIRATLTALSGEVHAATPALLQESTTFTRNAVLDQQERQAGSIWGSVSAARARIAETDEAGRWEQNGSSYIAGVDSQLFEGAAAGIALSYGEGRAYGRGGTFDYDQIGVSAYGRVKAGPIMLQGAVARTWYDLKTDRTMGFTGGDGAFSSRLTGDADATATEALLDAAFPQPIGKAALTAFVGIRYFDLDIDRLRETGGEAALLVPAKTSDQTWARLGLRGKLDLPDGPVPGRIRASLVWEHSTSDLDPARGLAWPAAGGSAFRVIGNDLPDDIIEGDLGTEVRLSDWSLLAAVQYRAGGDLRTISTRLTARLDF